MEFTHPCFVRHKAHLLSGIQRKHASGSFTSGIIGGRMLSMPFGKRLPLASHHMNTSPIHRLITSADFVRLSNIVGNLKLNQETMNQQIESLKSENQLLCQELAGLREHHEHQSHLIKTFDNSNKVTVSSADDLETPYKMPRLELQDSPNTNLFAIESGERPMNANMPFDNPTESSASIDNTGWNNQQPSSSTALLAYGNQQARILNSGKQRFLTLMPKPSSNCLGAFRSKPTDAANNTMLQTPQITENLTDMMGAIDDKVAGSRQDNLLLGSDSNGNNDIVDLLNQHHQLESLDDSDCLHNVPVEYGADEELERSNIPTGDNAPSDYDPAHLEELSLGLSRCTTPLSLIPPGGLDIGDFLTNREEMSELSMDDLILSPIPGDLNRSNFKTLAQGNSGETRSIAGNRSPPPSDYSHVPNLISLTDGSAGGYLPSNDKQDNVRSLREEVIPPNGNIFKQEMLNNDDTNFGSILADPMLNYPSSFETPELIPDVQQTLASGQVMTNSFGLDYPSPCDTLGGMSLPDDEELFSMSWENDVPGNQTHEDEGSAIASTAANNTAAHTQFSSLHGAPGPRHIFSSNNLPASPRQKAGVVPHRLNKAGESARKCLTNRLDGPLTNGTKKAYDNITHDPTTWTRPVSTGRGHQTALPGGHLIAPVGSVTAYPMCSSPPPIVSKKLLPALAPKGGSAALPTTTTNSSTALSAPTQSLALVATTPVEPAQVVASGDPVATPTSTTLIAGPLVATPVFVLAPPPLPSSVANSTVPLSVSKLVPVQALQTPTIVQAVSKGGQSKRRRINAFPVQRI